MIEMNGLYGVPQALYKAESVVGTVSRNDVQGLQELLKEKEKYGLDDLARALQTAADRGFHECARILLEARAMPNLHDASGFTPIVMAAKKGHLDVINLLIKHKANVNKPTYRVRATALHWAATNGHTECVEALLKGGANPEARTVHGRTALMLAARSDQADIVSALIEAGAKVNARDFEKASAIHLAAEEGADDVVRVLLRAGAEVDGQTKNGDTPVMRAAVRGQTDVVKRLLRRECDLDKRGHNMSALHWAADGGRPEVIDILIKHKMDPNIKTKDSYYGGYFVVNANVTPLMLAARKGHGDALKMLIKKGALIDAVDEEENTALLYAIKSKHPDCILILLRAGADPNGVPLAIHPPGVSELGLSPLFYCLKNNNLDALKILLRANCGLSVRYVLKEGTSVGPVEFALLKGHITASKMLVSAGITISMINLSIFDEAIAWLIEEDEDTCAWLMNQLRTPRSLLHHSRKTIRTSLGMKSLDAVEKLPLPPPLLRYVEYSDLDDFQS